MPEPFDWYEDYTEDEEIGERAEAWMEEALDRFFESPEIDLVPEDLREPMWINLVRDFAHSYFRATLSRLTPEELAEILLDIIPRKVSTEASEAFSMIAQLQAFYRFADRAFRASNAGALLEIMTPELTDEMHRHMSDPSYFGMAKSMVMRGVQAGFDMKTEEGMAAAMAAYNHSLISQLNFPPDLTTRLREARTRAKERKKAEKKSRGKKR